MKTIPSKVQVDYPIQYQEYQGKNRLVLNARWDKDDNNAPIKTVKCAFCGKQHINGKSEGHRVAHCSTNHDESISCVAADGTILNSEDGYMIAKL